MVIFLYVNGKNEELKALPPRTIAISEDLDVLVLVVSLLNCINISPKLPVSRLEEKVIPVLFGVDNVIVGKYPVDKLSIPTKNINPLLFLNGGVYSIVAAGAAVTIYTYGL
jgi:hypothetical protein